MGVFLTSPRPSHGALNWDTALEADLAGIRDAINLVTSGAPSGDFNQIALSGVYAQSSAANAPGGSTNTFFVQTFYRDANTIVQIGVNLIIDGALFMRRKSGTSWSPWVQVVTAASDTGWVTASTGITAATGWTLNSSKYRVVNGVVSIGASVTRTGTAIAVDANGKTASTQAVLLPAALVPVGQANGNIGNGPGGSVTVGAYVVASSSSINIITGPPSGSIAVSATVDLLGTYLL